MGQASALYTCRTAHAVKAHGSRHQTHLSAYAVRSQVLLFTRVGAGCGQTADVIPVDPSLSPPGS